jgi:hypothetical protein
MKIGYNSKLIPSALSKKFLGLTIHIRRMQSWRIHVDHLTIKLSSACYVIKSIKPLMTHKTLQLVYHSLFHSHELQGKKWGNSCHRLQVFGCKSV